jgi:hypothetical protein
VRRRRRAGILATCTLPRWRLLAARVPTRATIYRKTAKGQAEIETRALRLPPRLRSALILVDGKRSDEELHKLILQEPAQTLRWLNEQALIEAVGVAPPAAWPPQTAAPRTPQPPAQAPANEPAPALRAQEFKAWRADMVRSFTDAVGPMSEALALKMERARDDAELRPLAQMAQRIIANARGAQAASDFSQRFL